MSARARTPRARVPRRLARAPGARPPGARRRPAFPCARCGRPLRRSSGESPRKIGCPRCGYLIYDYPRPCAGLLVLRGGDVLTLRRGYPPRRGALDIPGGFLEAGESIEQAARRELKEETGLEVGRVRSLGVYWDRYHLKGFGRFPTMNFYFIARWRGGEARAGDDAASAEWLPLERLARGDPRFAFRHMTAVFQDLRRLVKG